jgi:hypothetical protein
LIKRALEGVMIETDAATLTEVAAESETVPRGFIFHTSRSGSTLLANILRAVDGHVVFSEPSALSSLFDGITKKLLSDQTRQVDLVRSTMGALARIGGPDARCFIKHFSHDIHNIPTIRAAAPAVREVFVYRDPLEVLVANLSWPTQPWLWNETYTGLPIAVAVQRPVAELFARGIGLNMQAMLEHADDRTLLLNYSEIGPQTPRLLMQHFGVAVAAENLCRMERTLLYDSKDSLHAKVFRADRMEKQAAATEFIRGLSAEHAEPAFQQLEKRRLAQARTP